MKTLNKLIGGMGMVALTLFAVSCDDDDNNTNNNPNNPSALEQAGYQMMQEADLTGSDLSVSLYAKEDFFTGYNYIATQVMDGDNNVVSNASVEFLPMMDMGAMMHSTPFEQPVYNADVEAFEGTASFIMPSQGGNWMFKVIVSEAGGTPDTVNFDIEVMEKEETRMRRFISAADSSTRYFVALKEPMQPEVGMNDFELMIYKRQSMMMHPPAGDLSVEIEPTMPTMGHGSPNNENPDHIENGLYRGKVNFTMTGYWKVDLTIRDAQGNLVSDEQFFDITFQ